MDKSKVTKDLEAKTFTIERAFNAPKEKVWQCYADNELFTQWWGPEGWETTTDEFNFTAPGGRNLYIMTCVDKNQGEFFGQEARGLMVYESIDAPNRIVYMDYFVDDQNNIQQDMPALRMTINFQEDDDKTIVTAVCHGESAEDIERLLEMGMNEGFDSSCNKLDALLATM